MSWPCRGRSKTKINCPLHMHCFIFLAFHSSSLFLPGFQGPCNLPSSIAFRLSPITSHKRLSVNCFHHSRPEIGTVPITGFFSGFPSITMCVNDMYPQMSARVTGRLQQALHSLSSYLLYQKLILFLGVVGREEQSPFLG